VQRQQYSNPRHHDRPFALGQRRASRPWQDSASALPETPNPTTRSREAALAKKAGRPDALPPLGAVLERLA
jgi:hypothetical protein